MPNIIPQNALFVLPPRVLKVRQAQALDLFFWDEKGTLGGWGRTYFFDMIAAGGKGAWMPMNPPRHPRSKAR